MTPVFRAMGTNGVRAHDTPLPQTTESPRRSGRSARARPPPPGGSAVSVTTWATVAVFAAVCVLIATEWVHRVAAALGGTVAMLLIGATSPEDAFFSEHTGVDWNVLTTPSWSSAADCSWRPASSRRPSR